MSKFAARMSRVVDRVNDGWGDPAVFTARDTSNTDCTVIVDENLSTYGDVAEISGKTAVIRVRTSELSEVPRREEFFTMDDSGEVYAIDSVLDSDEFEHWCLVA